MRVITTYPVERLEGKTARSVFTSSPQGTFVRERICPVQPNSPDQLRMRAFLRLATGNWDELSEAQRDAWNAYAAAHFAPKEPRGVLGPQGLAIYTKACVRRQILGLGLLDDAPTAPPPTALLDFTIDPAADPNEVRLTLTHAFTETSGLSVLVRLTPPLATVACHPRPEQLRLARGVGPASAVALVASGGQVTLGAVRFSFPDAVRYGVELRVVRASDGMAGPAQLRDAIRRSA